MRKTTQLTRVLWLVFFVIPLFAKSQISIADYKRADSVYFKIRDKVFYSNVQANWIKETHTFWYLRKTPKGKEFILVDAEKNTKNLAFDHEKLAKELSVATKKEYKAENLPFDKIEFKEPQIIEFKVDTAIWNCDLNSYKCTYIKSEKNRPNHSGYWGEIDDERGSESVDSPDKEWKAYIKNYNVYIRSEKEKKEYQLSFDGSKGEYYSKYIQWSPDSKKLVGCRVRGIEKPYLQLTESSPADQLLPRNFSRPYLRPGDALIQKRPQLFLVNEKKQIDINPESFTNQFSLQKIEWKDDSQSFTFEFNQRGHQIYRVIEVNANTGKPRILIEEKSNTFVYYNRIYRYDVKDKNEIIWASERDGWYHLYLYDAIKGTVKNQITKGKWIVREVVNVDEKKRQIIFKGSGLEQGQDPYLIQYYRVNFDGSGFTKLTTENGNHNATFSSDYQYFTDVYSRADMPSVSVLRSAKDGKILMELEKSDISELEKTGWKKPEVFSAKGRDGKTDIWGIILRPTNFDPSKKYPIVEYIYAGPHDSFVPKTFNNGFSYYQALCELGFIVVQIDGMGTANRSKAFHDVCWKNLKDAGFPDRIAWIKAAADKYSYMDTTRVGIYGASAGGQSSAGAVLFYPEFYKVAVSACGCQDNRMDKIWWNEQWMGYPIGKEYAECSNVVNAYRLKGKLMLIVGEIDENVDPSSTYQVADALIKANKEFELVVLPGKGHTLGDTYGERKRRDFFVRYLLGVNPPDWNK